MKYFFLGSALMFFGYIQAQLPDYYVYMVAGSATVTKPGGKPRVLKQRDLIFKYDTLKLNKGMALTLVDKDASFLSLNGPVICLGANLAAKADKKGNDGVTAKYLHLLYNELLNPSPDFEKFKKENIAGIRAGVSRGSDCNNRIFPVNGLKTSSPSLVFRWKKTSPSSNYSFEIYDGGTNELLKINVRDTIYSANINEIIKNKPGTYSWRVVSDDGHCESEMPGYFEILTPTSEQKLVSQFTGGQESNRIDMRLKEIDKLEKNGLITTALSAYSSLSLAHAEDKALNKSYVVFLMKYGFDDEARAAWKP